MRQMRYFLLTFLGLISLIMTGTMMVSCIDDAMTTSSSDVLTFSRDTVDFDTVFKFDKVQKYGHLVQVQCRRSERYRIS